MGTQFLYNMTTHSISWNNNQHINIKLPDDIKNGSGGFSKSFKDFVDITANLIFIMALQTGNNNNSF